jgi:hypothetical protein
MSIDSIMTRDENEIADLKARLDISQREREALMRERNDAVLDATALRSAAREGIDDIRKERDAAIRERDAAARQAVELMDMSNARIARLVGLLKEASGALGDAYHLGDIGDFRNGVEDSSGTIDEGVVLAGLQRADTRIPPKAQEHDMISGFLRGNHTFRTWPTPQDAHSAVSKGIEQDDADYFEMAFVGHGHSSKRLHREMREGSITFLSRAETFFKFEASMHRSTT